MSTISKERLDLVKASFKGLSAKEIVAKTFELFAEDEVVIASSFSGEDQVITDFAAATTNSGNKGRAEVITLDTGRVFEQVHLCFEESARFWDVNYTALVPDSDELSALIKKQGTNGFYESVENRKACCQVRKIDSLKRALAGKKAWICGLREAQSMTREGVGPVVWDAQFGIFKILPLFNWSEKQVWDYVDEKGLPYVSLQKKGFPSIGCAPCTRAVAEGADVRSGRWWWENPETKECGLHK